KIIQFSRERAVDLVVVGPETPLIAGLADALESEGVAVFGPSRAAAQIEGSKVFTKQLLAENGITTGTFTVFSNPDEAASEIRQHFAEGRGPLVIKADGEAAGKGVVIAENEDAALQAIDQMMVRKVFGASGERIIIEEYLVGQEASLMVFADGEKVAPMTPAQDYKRAYDGDKGPNTGGMGCYSPVPALTPDLYDFAVKNIIQPTLSALMKKGIHYKGVLYAGLILTEDGPKLLEYNCRFGDPETQVVLPLLETDLVDVMEAVVEGRLDEIEIKWYNRRAVCVVLASGGYPGDYDTGFPINGLADAESAGAIVFHAGTKIADGQIVTAGGRVLGITAISDTFADAVSKAYSAVEKIRFQNMYYRKDIGARVL
ncbi:MAG TPA: phosphoribosylamine--glycine ligase, partial [Armatimonadota bacterium]|nr:phosphoribosylamine--glycine ligase [Armatimonadota bacterium]